jgi:Phage integrase family
LEQIVRRQGIPLALSVDRHGIFPPNQRPPLTLDEELAGGRAPPQVGRVLGELGIRHIAARSPQAKGRVERLWGTWQDRLVAELAAAVVTALAAANAFLPAYRGRHNARFAVPATDAGLAYPPVPASLNLVHICCFKHTRVVRPDNTISFQTRLKKAALSRMRFHDLRHGTATMLLARGVDLRTISDILGHSQYSTTADLYAHVAPQLKREAADKLDEAFGT